MHVDTICLSMLISVEVLEQTIPSKYVLFICLNTWMALFFLAAILWIINTVISERWPLSTYLWHLVLLFQCKKCATSPHITSPPRSRGYTRCLRCARNSYYANIFCRVLPRSKCNSSKTCLMCTICTLKSVRCSNGTMNNTSSLILWYRWLTICEY